MRALRHGVQARCFCAARTLQAVGLSSIWTAMTVKVSCMKVIEGFDIRNKEIHPHWGRLRMVIGQFFWCCS